MDREKEENDAEFRRQQRKMRRMKKIKEKEPEVRHKIDVDKLVKIYIDEDALRAKLVQEKVEEAKSNGVELDDE